MYDNVGGCHAIILAKARVGLLISFEPSPSYRPARRCSYFRNSNAARRQMSFSYSHRGD